MDFIERLFGFSPDGGDGTFEVILIITPLLTGALIWLKRYRSHKARDLDAPLNNPTLWILTSEQQSRAASGGRRLFNSEKSTYLSYATSSLGARVMLTFVSRFLEHKIPGDIDTHQNTRRRF